MKGSFNQGWWNCFESFAAELLFTEKYPDELIKNVLSSAGITDKEAYAWLNKPIERNPGVEAIVRDYWLHLKDSLPIKLIEGKAFKCRKNIRHSYVMFTKGKTYIVARDAFGRVGLVSNDNVVRTPGKELTTEYFKEI